MPGNEIREQKWCVYSIAYVMKEGCTCKSRVGPLGQGQKEDMPRNCYPVSNYEVE